MLTGTEVGLLGALVAVVSAVGGRYVATKGYLTKERHELLCSNVCLRFEAKIEEAKKAIIKAIEDNGRCTGCKGDTSRTP